MFHRLCHNLESLHPNNRFISHLPTTITITIRDLFNHQTHQRFRILQTHITNRQLTMVSHIILISIAVCSLIASDNYNEPVHE